MEAVDNKDGKNEYVNNRKVKVVNYSSAQTSVFDGRFIPWRAKRIGKVFLVSAVGGNLVSISIALVEGDKNMQKGMLW